MYHFIHQRNNSSGAECNTLDRPAIDKIMAGVSNLFQLPVSKHVSDYCGTNDLIFK